MSDASLPEQLLSAFADGQLTGPEKKRAEQLIAENPHYAELVEQWRAQGKLIRELPRYRLDRDFSDRVLAKFNLEQSVAEPASRACDPPKNSLSNSWDGQSAAAAILALAAMILLTLFVFPREVSNVETVSKVSNSKSGHADSVASSETPTEPASEFESGDREVFEDEPADPNPEGEAVAKRSESMPEQGVESAEDGQTRKKSDSSQTQIADAPAASAQLQIAERLPESNDEEANKTPESPRGLAVAPISPPAGNSGIAIPDQPDLRSFERGTTDVTGTRRSCTR